MARHLKQLTAPIAGYLKQRFSFINKSKGNHRGNALSPILEIAFLQGEALLRQRFFNFLQQHNINNPETQLHFWEQFYQGAEVFEQFCQASELIKAFKGQTSEGYQQQHKPEQLRYTAYCCLIWDLHINKESSLLSNTTDRLFAHYIASTYPAEAAKQTVDELKREIRKHLAEQWQMRPEIKESFKVGADQVEFTLIAKISSYHPRTLITLEGKRLKPTRLNACKVLLQQLQQSNVIACPLPRATKKSQTIQPL
jgi:hypothetical protein